MPGVREAAGSRCSACVRPLHPDEIALTKKLVSRGAESFLCLSCLARRFDVSEETLKEKITCFRAMGCTLFGPEAGGS